MSAWQASREWRASDAARREVWLVGMAEGLQGGGGHAQCATVMVGAGLPSPFFAGKGGQLCDKILRLAAYELLRFNHLWPCAQEVPRGRPRTMENRR
jgi:hypothetical protein